MIQSVDTQVEFYADPSFNASSSAARFFAEHSDSEVQRKLNDLAILQTHTETRLREAVAENYSSFVQANAEIRSLGSEMTGLKELVANTLKLVQDIKANKVLDAKPAKSENAQPKQQQAQDTHRGDKLQIKIPKWVMSSSEDLDRLIIEHQYSQAVVLINRTQDYYETVVGSDGALAANSGGETERLRDISVRVKEKGAVLAQVLKTSIMRLPNSELWGASELYRQLKLLIQLGYRKAAADGFVQTQVDSIRKALRSVDVSGDPGQYTTELSRVFFLCLERACKGFVELFSSGQPLSDSTSGSKVPFQSRRDSNTSRPGGGSADGPTASNSMSIPLDVLAHLLTWLQSQIAVFASMLSRQIQLGASEYADLMFEQYSDYYRSSAAHSAVTGLARLARSGSVVGPDSQMGRMSRSESIGMNPGLKSRNSIAPAAGAGRARRMSITVGHLLQDAAISTNPPPLLHSASSMASGGMTSMHMLTGHSKLKIGVGPLTFASDCLQSVFKESIRLDLLGLEGSSSLGWTLLPEIKILIRNFTSDIIDEIGAQVQEDSWFQFKEPQTHHHRGSFWPAGILYNPATHATSRTGGVSRRSLVSSSAMDIRERSKSTGSNSPLAAAAKAVQDELGVSSSYVWLVAVMSEFLAEVWVLLQAVQRESGDSTVEKSPETPLEIRSSITPFGMKDKTQVPSASLIQNHASPNFKRGSPSQNSPPTQYYSRDDVCEIEPEIVSCMLRILVRYVRDIENVVAPSIPSETGQSETADADSAFDDDVKRECFIKTVEAIHNRLIPALDEVIWANFFSDGSVLVLHPAKNILNRLSSKVSDLLDIIKKAWKKEA